MRDLFTKIQSPEHCLYPLLPPKRGRSNRHRPKGHDYELPNRTYNFHKQSYVINCLFRFLYWLYIAYIHTVLCVYVCYMLLINTLTLTLMKHTYTSKTQLNMITHPHTSTHYNVLYNLQTFCLTMAIYLMDYRKFGMRIPSFPQPCHIARAIFGIFFEFCLLEEKCG